MNNSSILILPGIPVERMLYLKQEEQHYWFRNKIFFSCPVSTSLRHIFLAIPNTEIEIILSGANAIVMPSTVISHFSYDATVKALRITTVSGLVYEYENVPESVYVNMKESRAKGIFFNKEIKDKYEWKKIMV
jgi:hypothetical protein